MSENWRLSHFFLQARERFFLSLAPVPFVLAWKEIAKRHSLLRQVFDELLLVVDHSQESYPCGKNCLTCKYISDGQTSYTFHATGETRPITNYIDCNSKNVIYMIQCNQCSKQYIGETKRRLKNRFNEHRRPVDNPSNISKPTTVSEHFLTNDHSANDITLIPLELTKCNRDSVRKAREAYLIERGKTLEPLGINKKDEM